MPPTKDERRKSQIEEILQITKLDRSLRSAAVSRLTNMTEEEVSKIWTTLTTVNNRARQIAAAQSASKPEPSIRDLGSLFGHRRIWETTIVGSKITEGKSLFRRNVEEKKLKR